MNLEIILDKAIELMTEIENICLALIGLTAWWKGRREKRQLTEIMHFSETKNEDFCKLAEQKGLKAAEKAIRKFLPSDD